MLFQTPKDAFIYFVKTQPADTTPAPALPDPNTDKLEQMIQLLKQQLGHASIASQMPRPVSA
jgi:hypothetical protein